MTEGPREYDDASSITGILRERANAHPHGLALEAPERAPATYANLYELVDSVADCFRVVGLTREDRVGIVLPNGPEMAAAFLSVGASACCAPLNPSYRDAEFEFYLSDLRARALIVPEGSNSAAVPVARRNGIAILELQVAPDAKAGMFKLSSAGVLAPRPARTPESSAALVLHTSGTTSRPKIVPLSERNLCASARNIATTLKLTDEDRCLNVMPLFHIHGLVAATLSSLIAGGSVVCTPGLDAKLFFVWLEKLRPTWYTAVPTMHQTVLLAAKHQHQSLSGHTLRFIRSASAALPTSVMADLEALFKVPVLQAYGMTEASHQVTSNPLPPCVRKAESVGLSTGPEIAVADPSGRLVHEGVRGEVVIRGPNVMAGYEGVAEVNKNAFFDGWLRTGDEGYLDKDGYLFLTGRLKELINRAGEKISPLEVDNILMQHPAVAQAVTFAAPHPLLGEVPAAAVVLHPGASVAEAELRDFTSRLLADYKVPTRILIVDQIPKGPTGKLQRIGLSRSLGLDVSDSQHATTTREHRAPRNATQESLGSIWREVLGVGRVGIYDDFFELGGQSLSLLRVAARIKGTFGVEIRITALYEAPTIAEMSVAILSAQRARESMDPAASLRRVSRTAPCRASFAQERMWFVHNLAGGGVYNNQTTLRLQGRLDQTSLSDALNMLVRRHEVLRTVFRIGDDVLEQVIGPAFQVDPRFVDLSSAPEEHRQAQLLDLLEEDARTPFDLKSEVMRARLVRLGEREHVLAIQLHHIASDGWSKGVLWKDLSVLYAGTPALSELPVQYADFATWQRERMNGAELARLLGYWTKTLEGAPDLLELPTDRPRLRIASHGGARCPIELPTETTIALARALRPEGATTFMVLLTAFQILLHRYSGQKDVVVATPVANRTLVETEGLIGPFMNTVALRARFEEDPSCLAILRQVRTNTLAGVEHQELPFDLLVAAMTSGRDIGHSPIAQTLFSLELPLAPPAFSQLDAQYVEIYNGTAKLDLSLQLFENAGSVEGYFEFNSDLFDFSTVARIADHYCVLLASMATRPEQRVSHLTLVSEGERHQLLIEWNDTRADSPYERCIHQIFEEQVDRTPEAVAAVFESEQLTYRQLDRRANQLANHLRALGVGPDVPVGVCVERSIEMVVVLIGVLKSGGAYVPIDISLTTASRALHSLKGAGVRLVCVSDQTKDFLQGSQGITPVFVAHSLTGTFGSERLSIATSPTNIAYVLFTSGSTGLPKGVAVEHRQLLNYVLALSDRVSIPSEAAYAYVSTFAADLGHTMLFPALLRGGTLHVIASDRASSGAALGEYMDSRRIDCLKIVPSHLAALLAEPGMHRVLPRTRLILGGEASGAYWVSELLSSNPACMIHNHYGPTETTVGALTFPVSRLPSNATGNVPIGRPMANMCARVLDGNLVTAPLGVPAELYIGGAGVARGYANQRGPTAARFLPDPFSAEGGARMYRTGDLVRCLADGNLQFLGRIDHQVKIRGFRIELGEIEAQLATHGSVREAIVLAREDTAGEKRLAAYVTPKDVAAPPTIDGLRDHLRARVPDYMIPGAWVVLEALPLTPNGKVNRRALPPPDSVGSVTRYEAPRNDIEEQLCGIFADLLGVQKVGIHDDFFALGGHSLLLIRLVNRIRSELGMELTVRTFFQYPSVAKLAPRARGAPSNGSRIPRATRTDRLPLSYAQERLWFLDQLEPGSTLYNVPRALRLMGELNEAALLKAFDTVIERHDSLRTTFEGLAGQAFQRIHAPRAGAAKVEDASNWDEPAVLQRARQEAQTPFDLQKGPLIRLTLLRRHRGEYVLLVTTHHIVSDAWSFDVLRREVGVLYEAFLHGKPNPLAELEIQYSDFAIWQRHFLDDKKLDRELRFWREQLANAPTLLEFPTDQPRPTVPSHVGGEVVVELGNLNAELRASAQAHDVTPFMLLLATYGLLLGRHANQRNVVVGSPIAGRTRAETEPLIGFFANTVALHIHFEQDTTFAGLVGTVKQLCLEAHEHQELPFEKLVEAINPLRDMSRAPVFQAMFALETTQQPVAAWASELAVEPLVTGLPRDAKFDLALTVRERGGGKFAELNYAVDLFADSTAMRLLEHWRVLLGAACLHPKARCIDLPMVLESERHQLLTEWNGPIVAAQTDLHIHELIERQAEQLQATLAVVDENRCLTYGALAQKVTALSGMLCHYGVGLGDRIALSVERSADAVIAILAILRSGATYVPVALDYPAQRLSYILSDAKPKLWIIDEFNRAAGHPAHAVAILSELAEQAEQGDFPPRRVARCPTLPAYIIYTSGSTGRPNGVTVTHAGIENLLRYQRELFGFEPGVIALQFASLGFDASLWEILGCLLHGSTLVVARDECRDPIALKSLLTKYRVTTAFIPPAVLRTLEPDDCPTLRHVVAGGDALDPSTLHKWAGRALVNAYGPTEFTVQCIAWRVSKSNIHIPAPNSIGRPNPNVNARILDRDHRIVPIGVAGEVCLSGVQLAQGYHGRAGLTAARFVPDPFAENAGSRMYRSGDLARWLNTGELEFLGRIDQQVKIRGFRIELGEIEAHVIGHPSVQEAIVLARTDEPGGRRLVAYLRAKDAACVPTGDELREYLRMKLPDYMIPSAWVWMSTFPVTPNGKLDRAALPAPHLSDTSAAYVAPRNALEEQLCSIFMSVLGVPRVGIHDDFFALGGHSLLITRVANRIRLTLGIECSVRVVFQYPTVALLARNLGLSERTVEWSV
jgi:amino acid adenylation domain-containing protein